MSEDKFKKATFYGIPCLFNIETNEIKGTNFITEALVHVMIFVHQFICEISDVYFDFMIKVKDDEDEYEGLFDLVDDMLEYMETKREKEKREALIKYYLTRFWWFIERKYNDIIYFFRSIKWFFQRGFRGYGDNDIWSLHYYLSKIIVDSVKELKKVCTGFPAKLDDVKDWYKILDKIIYTFEIEQKLDEEFVIIDKNLSDYEELKKIYEKYNMHIMTEEEIKEYEEGWRLFKEYFRGIWD